jgi:predicted nucleic acid-binding protein
VRELRTDDELTEFAHFSELLVRKGRNRGEAGVLALAKSIPAIAILDDSAARKAADSNHVDRRGTLGLMIDAIRSELLTVKLVSAIADDLLATEYHLPFKRGRFEQWAVEHAGL